MKPDNLNQLFSAAAKAPAPAPSGNFAADVLRAVRREPSREAVIATFADQLGALLPRVAFATALIVVACVAADVALDSLGRSSLTDGVSQLSEQWLFAAQ
ncbi:MAG: hypothetical protein RLY20_2688 [Verrucomicrobiota bacterium]|jgi:hypothetical protein